MAIQNSSITAVGKFGNMVGRKGLDGKTTMSIYQPIVANPQTQAQMETRARLALSTKVASMLGILGGQVNVANGYRDTRMGKLIAKIFANTTVNAVSGKATLLPTLDLVTNVGFNTETPTDRLTVTKGTSEASGSANLTIGYTAPSDDIEIIRTIGAVLVYDEETNQWRYGSTAFNATSGSVRVYHPFTAGPLHAYGYSMAIGRVKGSGISIGGLSGVGEYIIALDANGVAHGSYLYTQINSTTATAM